jgi:hypothetical protein
VTCESVCWVQGYMGRTYADGIAKYNTRMGLSVYSQSTVRPSICRLETGQVWMGHSVGRFLSRLR